jgi:hypothetical protein
MILDARIAFGAIGWRFEAKKIVACCIQVLASNLKPQAERPSNGRRPITISTFSTFQP